MAEPPRKRMVRPPGGGGDGRAAPQRLKSGKPRSASSRAWLERQLSDPFVAAAKAKGYRSRAAFKLTELDERFHLIRRGAAVVDLGCAPGGWLQVLLERGAGRVVGVDILPTDPLSSATILQGDFTHSEFATATLERLGVRPDLVVSDMAPNTTGHRQTDHLRIVSLVEAAADFARRSLKPGGAFVAKAFQGGETAAVLADLKRDYSDVRTVKPGASRAESSEVYLVARGFRGVSDAG
jgi:23S rRNA (uridine2552-2'-O)-methyltransferase